MEFSEIIKKVNGDKRLVPDLMKAENGNNFRAISESAILNVIDPVLSDAGIFYTVEVKEQHLDIKEAFGSKGRKLQFIASLTVKLNFYSDENEEFICATEGAGMGIDDNDKAMGKAYTYAVKYALLKLFRLRYGDDPDFKASEALHVEKPKESKDSYKEEKPKENKTVQKKCTVKKNDEQKEIPMSEKQRDYILGLMKQRNVEDSEMKNIYGYSPLHDEYIPMPKAREMIKWLEDGALPF